MVPFKGGLDPMLYPCPNGERAGKGRGGGDAEIWPGGCKNVLSAGQLELERWMRRDATGLGGHQWEGDETCRPRAHQLDGYGDMAGR